MPPTYNLSVTLSITALDNVEFHVKVGWYVFGYTDRVSACSVSLTGSPARLLCADSVSYVR